MRITVAVNQALQPIVGLRQGTKAEVLVSWYFTLLYFSERTLTEPHDIFASISSIAQLAYRVLQCRYLAGLWRTICRTVFVEASSP